MLLAKLDNQHEIYCAVQGEGRTVGKPCIFVRVAGCNLRCNYCDSTYTWGIDCMKNNISINDIVNEISAYSCKNVVFTGGEPAMYQDELIEIIQKLRGLNSEYYFEIETNGTILFKDKLLCLVNQINCSPKLESSGNSRLAINKPNVINQLKLYDKTIFKFVVRGRNFAEDMLQIKGWQNSYEIVNSRLWIMPEGTLRKTIIGGCRKIIDTLCCDGYNLGTRLHILIYQNKRGV